MKILFCSTGSAGHRLPMLPLAEAFVRRGHDVAWATAPDALPELTGRQFALFPAGLTMSGARQIYRQRWPEAAFLRGEALSAHTFPRLFGGVVAPAMLADLELILDRWQPAFVINEAAALAAPLACKRKGFKHVTHGFGLRLPPPHLASAMQEFGALWASADGPPPADGRLYEHLYLDIAPPGLSHSLAPTIPRSLLLRPASPRIREIMALPTSLRHMLSGSNRPLIYLSFGTVFNHSEALGMAAAALARLDATAIVTVGRDGDPGSLGGLPANVHVEPYVDQARLLPFCDAVVSHAGAGTLLGAAAHGLPQLLLPQAADQFRNAQAIATAGAGRMLRPEQLSVDLIESGLRDILGSTEVPMAARRLAGEILAMPSAEAVAAEIESFMDAT